MNNVESGYFFLIFSDTNRFLRFFLKKGFHHVMLAASADNCMFLMEKKQDMISLEAKSVVNDRAIWQFLKNIRYAGRHAYLVKGLTFKPTLLGKLGFSPNLGTCVSFVKGFLMIENPCIITPYQLYCYLNKKGMLLRIDF